ncbi:MAG: helix-turn-helix transcriptional regulator [Ferruginibacter sp.]
MTDKEKILLKFANHLTRLREEKGLSIRQLAASSGLEYSQVQRILKGKVNFAFTTMTSIAQGLDVDLQELLKGFRY